MIVGADTPRRDIRDRERPDPSARRPARRGRGRRGARRERPRQHQRVAPRRPARHELLQPLHAPDRSGRAHAHAGREHGHARRRQRGAVERALPRAARSPGAARIPSRGRPAHRRNVARASSRRAATRSRRSSRRSTTRLTAPTSRWRGGSDAARPLCCSWRVYGSGRPSPRPSSTSARERTARRSSRATARSAPAPPPTSPAATSSARSRAPRRAAAPPSARPARTSVMDDEAEAQAWRAKRRGAESALRETEAQLATLARWPAGATAATRSGRRTRTGSGAASTARTWTPQRPQSAASRSA